MSTQRSRMLVRALCALGVTIIALGSPFPGAAQATLGSPFPGPAPESASLIGGWRVIVGVGTPEEGLGVLLVNDGGTAHIQVSDGDKADGIWIKTRGRQFALTLDEFEDANQDGIPDQRYRVRGTVQVSKDNTFAGTMTIDKMSLDGNVVSEIEGQFPVEGTRMQVVPE